MDCEKIKYQLIDYLDGNLNQDISAKIEKHLNTCDSCQEEFIQTGKLLTKLTAIEDKEPSSKLKTNFYQMLETEKQKLTKAEKVQTRHVNFNQWIKIAAQIIVFVGLGVLIGTKLEFKNQQVSDLNNKVNNLEETIALMQLEQPLASQRLKAINASNKIDNPNKALIEALVKSMDNDENINVRMAAMYALSNYTNDENVKSALIASLEKQSDPLLQITLINILMNLKDNRAVGSFKNIIENEENSEMVKQQAREGLQVFI